MCHLESYIDPVSQLGKIFFPSKRFKIPGFRNRFSFFSFFFFLDNFHVNSEQRTAWLIRNDLSRWFNRVTDKTGRARCPTNVICHKSNMTSYEDLIVWHSNFLKTIFLFLLLFFFCTPVYANTSQINRLINISFTFHLLMNKKREEEKRNRRAKNEMQKIIFIYDLNDEINILRDNSINPARIFYKQTTTRPSEYITSSFFDWHSNSLPNLLVANNSEKTIDKRIPRKKYSSDLTDG